MWAVAVGGQQPPPPPGANQPTSPGVPDDEFIEFLGADDHGDAAWWEFLKNAPPDTDQAGASPPQDAKR
jgi:hypothetical protein